MCNRTKKYRAIIITVSIFLFQTNFCLLKFLKKCLKIVCCVHESVIFMNPGRIDVSSFVDAEVCDAVERRTESEAEPVASERTDRHHQAKRCHVIHRRGTLFR